MTKTNKKSSETSPRKRKTSKLKQESTLTEKDQMKDQNKTLEPTKISESKDERKQDLYNKLKVVHTTSPSILSSSSGFENYRGIINLCLLLLVLSNFRVALDNILKYGVLVDPYIILVFLENPYSWPSATLVILSNVFIQVCFYAERLLSKGNISERFGCCIHVFNICLTILVPIYVVFKFQPLPYFATMTLMWYTSVVLKMVSYASVNWWCREDAINNRLKDVQQSGPVKYPHNLTQKGLYYFMLAPTFCYELNFPQTQKIRKRFLIRRILEAVFLYSLILALVQQWLVPTVKNSMHSYKELDLGRLFERIMKLAIPNHLLWLLAFYAYFHSFLNIVSEVLYFGDRTFYKDWWNAPNVAIFWQNWNIPIHRWAKRHVYEPMLRNKYSKSQASMFVFFLSAFFHEFIVSIPLQMFRPYAFLSMLMQFPLAILTSSMKNPWGNIMMWLSLIIGQPLAIMMYYHDYLVEHSVIKV
ncbi:diacylglycerol O-acyltransferase 1-like [Hydra vulgaris]|uniref:O-acyltransferase n=1 Tax=Hydra vulgaris TaxID=6087 RepID=A0ABM4DNT1_HYDVU